MKFAEEIKLALCLKQHLNYSSSCSNQERYPSVQIYIQLYTS